MSVLRIPVRAIETLTVSIVMVLIAVLVNRDLLEMAKCVKVSKGVLTGHPLRLLMRYGLHFTTDFKPYLISFSLDVDECSAESSRVIKTLIVLTVTVLTAVLVNKGFSGDGTTCEGARECC